jgi:hypothetical protein
MDLSAFSAPDGDDKDGCDGGVEEEEDDSDGDES